MEGRDDVEGAGEAWAKAKWLRGTHTIFYFSCKFGCLRFAFWSLQFLVHWRLFGGPFADLSLEKCWIAQLPSTLLSACLTWVSHYFVPMSGMENDFSQFIEGKNGDLESRSELLRSHMSLCQRQDLNPGLC